uniref:Uncharacterized protein n=1 Tax=Stegastes partitus TaxID=144197 RepID=A0A3B5A2J9_9TELE
MEVVWGEDPLCHLQAKGNRKQESIGMSCRILLFTEHKCILLHRGRGSLRSISVLDRLLLTVPVWLQLSINPANALHILRRDCVVLQNFLVRKSRTSQRNVLCVRLADDSVPSFVQQFGIIEEQSSKSKYPRPSLLVTPLGLLPPSRLINPRLYLPRFPFPSLHMTRLVIRPLVPLMSPHLPPLRSPSLCPPSPPSPSLS